MIDSSKRALTLFFACWALIFLAAPVFGQEGEEPRPRKPAGEVNPSFEGENITKPAENADPLEFISALADELGGEKAYRSLKDLKYQFKHLYYMNDKLLYIQEATAYNRFGDRIKTRYDYKYINPKDFDETLDYREVVGDDGPFKFLRDKILRGPVPVKQAGERLIRYSATLFVPFCLDPKEANPRYLGEVTWNAMVDGKEKEITCHKILVEYNRKQANIEGNVLALYIDTKTLTLARMIFNLYCPFDEVEKLRIVDYKKRSPVEGVLLPSEIDITDIWDKKLYANRTIHFDAFQANTGLAGIGFEIFDQKSAEENKATEKGK